jgi:hypothetical protein
MALLHGRAARSEVRWRAPCIAPRHGERPPPSRGRLARARRRRVPSRRAERHHDSSQRKPGRAAGHGRVARCAVDPARHRALQARRGLRSRRTPRGALAHGRRMRRRPRGRAARADRPASVPPRGEQAAARRVPRGHPQRTVRRAHPGRQPPARLPPRGPLRSWPVSGPLPSRAPNRLLRSSFRRLPSHRFVAPPQIGKSSHRRSASRCSELVRNTRSSTCSVL